MNSLESNINVLGQGEVKTLANTLEHLGGSMDRLNKSGIVLNILIKVYKLLPYRCVGCVQEVSNSMCAPNRIFFLMPVPVDLPTVKAQE